MAIPWIVYVDTLFYEVDVSIECLDALGLEDAGIRINGHSLELRGDYLLEGGLIGEIAKKVDGFRESHFEE